MASPASPQWGLLVLLLLVPLAACAPSKAAKEPFTLLDFVEAKFTARTFKGTWVADNLLRFFNETTREVIHYNVEDNSTTVLVPGDVLKGYNDSAISSFSKDGRLVAISYETVKIYRHSTTSKFVIYDTKTGEKYPVHKDQQLRTLVWAGDRGILWVKDNDVYYRRDATSSADAEIRITTTGEGHEGVIFNGIPDWVYEEEVLASGSALWPSPDGSKLAFASFNDTFVKHTFYFKYGSPASGSQSQYPELVDITYPKAGTPNPDVNLLLVNLHELSATQTPKLIKIEPPQETGSEPILYGCFWTDKRLLASWTNRVQNKNIISSCDLDGSCSQALSQSEEQGWVDPPSLTMHSSGRRAAAILPKQDDDRPHLAVLTFSADAQTNRAFLTSGNTTVQKVLGWDEVGGHLYYVQSAPADPAQSHVYRVAVPGEDSNQVAASSPECLTCAIRTPEGNPCSYATATLSKAFTYAAVSCQGPDPTFTALYNIKNTPTLLRMWDENAEVRALLATRLRPEYLDTWYPVGNAADGFRARVRLLLPPGMDKTKKYPLLVYTYAGPDSNQVSTAFSVAFGDYLCTSRNIIYALIDGRGSGNDGRRKMHAVYRQLGTVEIQDQIKVASDLKKLPYVDPARTAIWGWSYGGFSTAHALAQDVGGVFCCGVSVAPVTSFIYYDTIYTERYLGLPTAEDNLSGYNGTDVTRRVDNFRNKKYLLIHGNADDNVHYQQSMELSRALEEADIMFQQQSYPEEAHSLTGVKKHVYHTMDEFWTRAFHLPKPEWANRNF